MALYCTSSAAEIAPEQLEFFEKRIRPVLAERCYQCHSAEAKDIKSGLLLDSAEGMRKGGVSGSPAIVPQNAEGSRLIEAIRYGNEELQMPPKKAGGKLSESQIADFASWINMGAPDPRTNQVSTAKAPAAGAKNHWAFQPVKDSALPTVKKNHWVRTPVDRFILAKLEENDLEPSLPADKRTLIRRATFDLTGLPPSVEEVEFFLKDTAPNAYEKVVDRLLSSRHYGERWGRHWLDVARFADTKGYVYGREESKFVHSYAYRDWVIRALNEDMPYDTFLKLQIAADQIEGADREALAAMGFLTLGRRFLGVVHDIIDDRIDVVTRGTLGLTVSCARCHDHKFDPIPTADYYSLYGVFAGSTERMVPLNSAQQAASAFLEYEKELSKREEKFQNALSSKREEQNKRLRAKAPEYLAALLELHKYPTEEFYSFVQGDDLNPVVVRQWHSYLLRAKKDHRVWGPWIAYAELPPNDFSTRSKSAISTLTNVNPLVLKAFQDKSPASMREVAEVYGNLLTSADKKWMAATDKSSALSKDEEELRQILYAPDSPAAVPMGALVDLEWYFDEATRVELGNLFVELERWVVQSPGAPPHAVILEDRASQKNPHIFRRGSPTNKGEEVPRRFLQIVSGENRKPFEKGSGRRELAEAIANKENPLTARVMVNRIWAHHFGAGIVRTPSDFGVRAETPTHPELLDWLSRNFMENGWSMKKLHRLIMLSAVYQQSSKENEGRGSALEKDPENKLLSRMNRYRLDFESLRDALLFASGQLDLKAGGKAEELFKPPFSKRRSVYGYIDRQFLPGTMRVFDFANPDMHTPQRSETTVPQQALFFMNGPFVVEQARTLAGTNQISEKGSAEKQIRELYRSIFQREPTVKQWKAGLEFIRSEKADLQQEESVKRLPTAWKYGFGEYDETAKILKGFEVLPHFTGDAWQGGVKWPDAALGWLQLTATGGHTGNDLHHAIVRRWVSPVDGTVSAEGMLKHERAAGEGIRAYLHSGRQGELGKWILLNKGTETKVENLEVKQGDTLDFIVSINTSLNNNDFVWVPVIRMVGPKAIRDVNGYAKEWNAQKEFSGPPPLSEKPLNAWEKYAQVLLLSNEFLFVD